MTPQPHVVIVGAGFAGLNCARLLGGSAVRVTLIDRRNYHLFQPLLYQVATAALSPAEIAEPVRRILGHFGNISVRLGDVIGVDAAARSVALGDGSHIAYDRLVLATGSATSYFGHPEWQRFAPGLKSFADARDIRSRVLSAFERAEAAPDPAQRARLLTSLIVGGGTTGVEMAGAVAELARSALARDFRTLRPADATVLLVEAGPRLLPGFPEDLSAYALGALQRLGVTVRLDTPVQDIGEAGVTAGGELIAAATVIWGAGVAASEAGRWLGVTLDRHGRVPVGPDLAALGVANIYVLGDLAHCMDAKGTELPGLAQVAQQQGLYLGRAMRARLTGGGDPGPFRYRDRGNLATIGRNAAVAVFGPVKLRGFVAWTLWSVVHIFLLIGFRNRAVVSLQWLIAYITNQRGARIITGEREP